MQFIVQSEIKLSSVECHIHLGAAGSAVALHIFGFSFAHPLLFLSLECVRNTSSSTQCRVEALWERRCLCFCGSSRVMVLVQRSSEWWVGRGRSRVGTGTAIFTCTLNLLLSGFEISAHLCFWLLNRAEWKGAFLLKKKNIGMGKYVYKSEHGFIWGLGKNCMWCQGGTTQKHNSQI